MSAWWGRLLEPAEIILILFCRLVLRRAEEEIENKNQTVSAVNFCFFFKCPLLCIRGKVW